MEFEQKYSAEVDNPSPRRRHYIETSVPGGPETPKQHKLLSLLSAADPVTRRQTCSEDRPRCGWSRDIKLKLTWRLPSAGSLCTVLKGQRPVGGLGGRHQQTTQLWTLRATKLTCQARCAHQ